MEKVKAKIEEIGDCWEWQAAKQKNSGVPVIRYEGRHYCARRAIAKELGHNLEGKIVTQTCGNKACVNPDHIKVMTKSALQKRTNSQTVYYQSITRRQKCSAARRKSAKLTPEKAEAIRNDPRPQRVIAEEYGITQPTVSSIKRQRMWRDYTSPFTQLCGALSTK
jgi:hypothetical protein